MALSEDDQRMLDQIERALMEQDPAFSRTMTIKRMRRRRAWAAVACFSVGVLLLWTGLIWAQGSLAWGVFISVTGFLLMVGSTVPNLGRRRRT